MPDQEKIDVAAEKRCIHFIGPINEDSTKSFMHSLLKLELEDPTKEILVIIDSYGGLIDSMWSMIDTMNLCRCKINTLCVGKAMSAGAAMLMNGTKGKRYCTPNSRTMIHKVSAGSQGDYDDLDIQMKELARIQKRLESFIISKTKFNTKTLEAAWKNDCYLTAEESKKLGIIDKVITSFSELKLKGW